MKIIKEVTVPYEQRFLSCMVFSIVQKTDIKYTVHLQKT